MAAVTEAMDGREAYRLALEHKPDIVLLDLDMPDCNVESLTKLIRQHLPDTTVLLLARYNEDTRIITATQAGAFGYVLKDIDHRDFFCASSGPPCEKPTCCHRSCQTGSSTPFRGSRVRKGERRRQAP